MKTEFEKLRIKKEILDVINKEGFEQPTSIQNKSIPYVLAGYDLIATAATGSGKTLIYVVGLVQNCTIGGGLQGLVIVPTRELAKQVGEVFNKFTENKPLNVVVSYGGSKVKEQKKNFEDIDILIATPGRVRELIFENILEFSRIKTLVLDEADSLFQGDFEEGTNLILKNMPRKKQTMVFSATIDKETYMKIKHWLKNPIRINVDTYVDPKKLKQVYYEVESNQKLSLLAHLLKTERAGLTLIFTNRQDTAEFLGKNLKDTGLEIQVAHGEMTQGRRNKIIKDFADEKFDVLISTDVAARGLDIENITHIYNYNIPKHHEKYIHRIGRTARAGKKGKVINFISKQDILPFVEVMRKHEIPVIPKELPDFDDIEVKNEFKKKKYKVKNKF